jgi:two-component system sensor histidine kinase TctE
VLGKLTQVGSNLVSSAIDASTRGIDDRYSSEAAGRHMVLVVSDHGDRIPATAKSMIFEPFFTTRKTWVPGLGLWISRHTVENHGGDIRFSRLDPWQRPRDGVSRQLHCLTKGKEAAR